MRQYEGELGQLIAREQQADGSFVSWSVPEGTEFGPGAIEYRTTFVTALIAGALAGVPGAEVAAVRRRAADWLVMQAGPQWSFNYWAREAAEAKSQPYPDDWDDTSCAVAALTLVRPEVVTGEVLGHVVTLLTNTEMAEGGPYRTWIVGAEAAEHWQDVDVAVNANIAYMLRLHGVELPNLERLVGQRIAADEVRSPYYPGSAAVEYFLARWYGGQQAARLLERVRSRRAGGRWGGVLETALAVSASLNLGAKPAEVAEAVKWLREVPAAEIQAEAFYYDPAIAGVKYVAGARALTAAVVLEAVANYNTAVAPVRDERVPKRAAAGEAEQVHERVLAVAMGRFRDCGPEILAAAERTRDRLLSGTAAGQITRLPELFRRALGPAGGAIGTGRLVELGLISLYGWMAYTVYDDFLDAEGDPTLLSMANVALRELVRAAAGEAQVRPEFGVVAWPMLDRQEAANAWEVRRCRVARQSDLLRVAAPLFGDLHALAERSLGHALGCLAITLELGYAATSAEVQAVQAFFYHFLIARQLGDDAHDWKEDLQKGQINAVAALLLRGVEDRGRSVRELYEHLERHLWEQAIGEVNERILQELAQARAALGKARFIQQPQVLEALLAPVEQAAWEARDQRQRTVEFLRSYRPGKR